MRTCPNCGKENRTTARFCWNCAAALTAFRPSDSDHAWLAATLEDQEQKAATGVTGALNPQTVAAPPSDNDTQEKSMEEPAPIAQSLFAGRYELPADAQPGALSVLDTMPWRRCWACGSTANETGESYCIDCGAALDPRSYRGSLQPSGNLAGIALIPAISEPAAQALLPEIADQQDQDGQTLTLIHDSGRDPIALPLDETAALNVGTALAGLLVSLHSQQIALGKLGPGDLEALVAGKTRLRDAAGLRRFSPDAAAAAVAEDLSDLAELLEQLTATPRTTQRLSEDEAAEVLAGDVPGIATVLREVRTEKIKTAAALAEKLGALLSERTKPIALSQIVGAFTDTGMVRDHNEDSYLHLHLGLSNNNLGQGWGIYIVSDGMGGHAAGEVASSLAIRSASALLISEYLARAVGPDESYDEAEARDLVRRAVLQANEAIIAEGKAQGNDMGATFTIALVSGDRAVIGNVGDSRTYLYREGKLRRISKDHSLVMRLVELGQINDEDVYTHPQRNAVLRSLGDKSDVEVDLFVERLRPGDSLLLCSDGQWEMTRDAEIERILARDNSPQKQSEELIAAANQAGGEDNIASIVVRFA